MRTDGCAVWKVQHYFPCHPCLCSSCTFSILTPNSHEARQFAHTPQLPKSEAVAPRYTWETGTTAQSPSRCSDMLPSSRMSSANNVLAEELSLRPSSGRRALRRDPGKAKDSTFSGPSSCPRESPTSTLSVRALTAELERETSGRLRRAVTGDRLRNLSRKYSNIHSLGSWYTRC